MMRSIPLGCGLLLLAAAGAAFPACAPAKLVRIVSASVPPGVVAGSFEAQPKVQYRLGNGRVRLEEQLNPAINGQLLTIISAPDAWQIDLVTKTGVHQVDRSEDITVHASVFEHESLPEEIRALEFGCEDEFIASPTTLHERLESKSGMGTKHFVVSGKWKVTLLVREGASRPFAAMVSDNGKVIAAIRYLSYDVLDEVPAGMFAPAPGISIKDAN